MRSLVKISFPTVPQLLSLSGNNLFPNSLLHLPSPITIPNLLYSYKYITRDQARTIERPFNQTIDQMARFLSNAGLLSGSADAIHCRRLLLAFKGSVKPQEPVSGEVARGGTRSGSMGNVNGDGWAENKRVHGPNSMWAPDPVTGYYRPVGPDIDIAAPKKGDEPKTKGPRKPNSTVKFPEKPKETKK
ncbi:hypothetical protein Ancab_013588 [Ancistrocladus abbreviatus]